jgi:ABC-type branched-subunit amino acid transport system substrate-binding protein
MDVRREAIGDAGIRVNRDAGKQAGRSGPATVALFAGLLVLLVACVPSTRPSVKIGLVGPFEGRYREIGEEVIYAVRLAVREANQSGGVAGYTVALAAFDDGGQAGLAAEQARKISVDPQVMGVMGNWLDSTTRAAAPLYAESGIALLAMGTTGELSPTSFRLWYTASGYRSASPESEHCPLPCDDLEDLSWLESGLPGVSQAGPALWGLHQFPRLAGDLASEVAVLAPAPLPADAADPAFADRYAGVSSGPRARYLAVLAYDAARILLAAIERDILQNGMPTRSGVIAALGQTDGDGLSGHFSFNSNREWVEAKGWVYRWQEGVLK